MMDVLNDRVEILLKHVDTMRKHIEHHEFDLAAMEARGLDLYCRGANQMANRLADNDPA